MQQQTTKLGKYIIEEAEKLLQMPCLDKTKNNGSCILSIVKDYDKWTINTAHQKAKRATEKTKLPAYCAMTTITVVDRAYVRYMKDKNSMYLPLTPKQNNPLRCDTLNEYCGLSVPMNIVKEAKRKGIRVDKKPIPGAIFIVSGGGASGHHAGIIWYVKKDTFGSIEGNGGAGYIPDHETGCMKKSPKNGVTSRERSIKKLQYVIHIEEADGTDDFAFFDVSYSPINEDLASIDGLENEGDSCVMTIPITDDIPYPINTQIENAKLIANDYKWLIIGAVGGCVIAYYAVSGSKKIKKRR